MSHATRYMTRQPSNGMMPLSGLLVRRFPEPGESVKAAMENLQFAGAQPPETDEDVRMLASLPRPWDPGSCEGRLRGELWRWLDDVAVWINEQQLWNVERPGIPECWPAHPHLTHDLAVVACMRYYTFFAVTPAALDDWHRYTLPMFLDRINERLGSGCQPDKHMVRPREERDQKHRSPNKVRGRKQLYRDDIERAAEEAAMTPSPPNWSEHG